MTVLTDSAGNPTTSVARRCFHALHPIHAAAYFAPEHDDGYQAVGLSRGKMAYLAGRAAPMGAVGAGPVIAAFHNFNPEQVLGNIPRAWQLATPEQVLQARLHSTDAYLTRLLGPKVIESEAMFEAASLALSASEGCQRPGRALYSANQDLPVPGAPHLALWHAITLLREHRGDGHVMALADAELDGLEALVTHSATGTGFTPAYLRSHRGWSSQDWAGAQQRLRERGLVDPAGSLTEAGLALRRQIEAHTDRLDLAPYRRLGLPGVRRLTELCAGFTQILLANGGLPFRYLGRGK